MENLGVIGILKLATNFILMYMCYFGYQQKKKGLRPKDQTAKNFKILAIMTFVLLPFLPFFIMASNATQKLILNGWIIACFLGTVGWLIHHLWQKMYPA